MRHVKLFFRLGLMAPSPSGRKKIRRAASQEKEQCAEQSTPDMGSMVDCCSVDTDRPSGAIDIVRNQASHHCKGRERDEVDVNRLEGEPEAKVRQHPHRMARSLKA